jgi:hypothetical protein
VVDAAASNVRRNLAVGHSVALHAGAGDLLEDRTDMPALGSP